MEKFSDKLDIQMPLPNSDKNKIIHVKIFNVMKTKEKRP